MNKTNIEWSDYTVNPITGCTPVSEGCQNCYAAALTKRFEKQWGDFGTVRFHPERLEKIAKIKKPSRIFLNSMSDLFHPLVKLEWFLEIRGAIERHPQHTFQILTKRPELALFLQETTGYRFSDNVWLGVTCENQKAADERIPILMKIPAAVKFVSFEPLLEMIEIDSEWTGFNGLDWIIGGAETGPKARECKSEWLETLCNQAKDPDACIPFFYKQGPSPEFCKVREFPTTQEGG